jgi:hypothetical protein
LIAIAKKDGIIPDGDIDICTYYEHADRWKVIKERFESQGFNMSKAILNDVDPSRIMYCGFNWKEKQTREQYASEEFYPHICVSFWYLHNGIRYYCHDQNHELNGPGVPMSGYFFKGFSNEYICDDTFFKRIEWPGIPGQYKVSVPIFPGLDSMYPGWLYNQQRYIVDRFNVQPDKLRDICRSGAISKYMVHVNSMGQWNDENYIKQELTKGELAWKLKVKQMRKK